MDRRRILSGRLLKRFRLDPTNGWGDIIGKPGTGRKKWEKMAIFSTFFEKLMVLTVLSGLARLIQRRGDQARHSG